MAPQAPAAPASAAPVADPNKGMAPPDEAFWIRYSPNHELPLSSVSSIAVHALVLGLLLFVAWLVAHVFEKPIHRPPVDAVRVAGGGGGRPGGSGSGPGVNTRPEEAGEIDPKANPDNTPPEPTERTRLDRIKAPDFQAQFDKDSLRFLNQPNPPPNIGKIALLDENVRRKIAPGPARDAGAGRGGSGSGGGQGDGQGTGTGDGRGPGDGGKAKLNQREKRMLRWTMLFDTNNGPDYLAQLRGLGAILAIPVKETAQKNEYQIVEDLKSPAQLLEKDVGEIKRIYWVDDKPAAVRDIMAALGLSIRPSHFVAFMPEELEKKLFELEKARAGNRPEDDIKETKFRVRRIGDRYEPVLDQITFNH